MAADRAPARCRGRAAPLVRGAWVVSDRFVPSSLAYQGVGRGLGVAEVEQLNQLATAGIQPDLVVVLDLSPEAARGVAAIGADRIGSRVRTASSWPPCTMRTAISRAAGAGCSSTRRATRRRGAGGLGCRGGASRAVSIAGWDRVVGQDAADRAARGRDRPSRARVSARRAAGLGRRRGGPLLSPRRSSPVIRTNGAEDLVLRGEHPDVVEMDPADDPDRRRRRRPVRTRGAQQSPIEGERKVVVLFGADGLNDVAANRLLQDDRRAARPHARRARQPNSGERLLPTIRSALRAASN